MSRGWLLLYFDHISGNKLSALFLMPEILFPI